MISNQVTFHFEENISLYLTSIQVLDVNVKSLNQLDAFSHHKLQKDLTIGMQQFDRISRLFSILYNLLDFANACFFCGTGMVKLVFHFVYQLLSLIPVTALH
jgi:hypothetical protein